MCIQSFAYLCFAHGLRHLRLLPELKRFSHATPPLISGLFGLYAFCAKPFETYRAPAYEDQRSGKFIANLNGEEYSRFGVDNPKVK
jgi:hypothetical protein